MRNPEGTKVRGKVSIDRHDVLCLVSSSVAELEGDFVPLRVEHVEHSESCSVGVGVEKVPSSNLRL